MKVLRATPALFALLDGHRSGNSVISFQKDGNGDDIVDTAILTDPAFASISGTLAQLEEIDYVPPTTPDL